MAKTGKATKDRAADLFAAAKENEYVQRLIEDEALRESLRDAFESARSAYTRAAGNGKSPVKAATSDKKVQKELRNAAESLREASERLKAPPKKRKHRLRKLLALVIAGGIVALVLSEGARKTVLDLLFGAEEEFEYTSSTSINGS